MSRLLTFLTASALLTLLVAGSLCPVQAQAVAPKAAATERAYYTVCMNLIEREWAANHVGRVLELLEETKDSRYRGFEWGYWNRLCHLDKMTLTGHAGGVTAVAYSPDGKSLLTGCWDDRTVKIREADTGRVTLTLEVPKSSWGTWGVNAAAFSPDSKRIVTCSHYTVIVWDAQTGNKVFTITEHGGAIRALFSPDGKSIATAGLDGWVKLFDAQTGKERLTIKERPVGSLYSIAFSPDGTRFASGTDDNTVLMWDTATGATLHALKGHTASIASVAFAPDGKRFASGSWDGTAKVWDAQTGKEILTLRGHTACVYSLVFALDGKRLITGSVDSSVRVWDTTTGKEMQAIKGHSARINSVALSPDGKRLLTGSDDNTAKIWDLERGEGIASHPRRQGRLTLAAVVDETKPMQIAPSKLPFMLNGRGVGPMTYSPDGRLVARHNGKNAEVWEIATGKLLCTLKGHGSEVFGLTFSADSKRVASGSGDNTATVWEVASGQEIQTFRGHTGAIKAVAFFPDGRRLVTGSLDSTARVWDIPSGRSLHTLQGHTGAVYAVAVHCEGKRVVTGGGDASARIWDTQTGRSVCTLPRQSEAVLTAFSLSPDGRRAVTGVQTPLLWDARTGKQICTLRGLSTYYYFVSAFAPDSHRVVVGGSDGVAKLFDPETGKELLTFDVSQSRLWLTHVAFSHDGKGIVIRRGDEPLVFLSDTEIGNIAVNK